MVSVLSAARAQIARTLLQLPRSATDVTSYQNGGLTRNTAYRYRVRAFNASGNSGYSNIAKERTPNR